MPTKITVIHDNPADSSAFQAGYADGQVLTTAALFPSIPGLTTGGVRILFSDVEQARTF